MRLYKDLPTTVHIGGKPYNIRSDYRIMLQFYSWSQADENMAEVAAKAISLFYIEIPEDIGPAFEEMLRFFHYEDKALRNTPGGGSRERAYDFDTDADYIYSAFMEKYGIDLIEIPYLHWFKFLALFRALGDEPMLSKIMSYRTIDISKMQGETRKFYAEMKRKFALPLLNQEQNYQTELSSALASGNFERIKSLTGAGGTEDSRGENNDG